MKEIPINIPVIGDEEKKEVIKVLESKILTHKTGSGPYVQKFEEAFRKFVGAKYAVALNSGTSALHAALLSAGIKRGDEVIVPSFTFSATAEAVLLTGATPIFADINPKTYCIDPSQLKELVTKKTKAVIPVHLYGLPSEMNEIREFAEENNLVVIGDAAQAHGAEYRGVKIGNTADIECFSFYATKNITCGEGGMCITNREEYFEKIKMIRSHGEKEPYLTVMIGHNYHLSELSAALGYVQTLKLPKILSRRRENASLFTEELEETEALDVPFVPSYISHAWYLYTLKVKDNRLRDFLFKKLRGEGVGVGKYYEKPLHTIDFFKKRSKIPKELKNTVNVSSRILQLPVHPEVSKEQVLFIAEKVKNFLKKF